MNDVTLEQCLEHFNIPGVHWACEKYPMIPDDEFAKLVEHVRENGVQNPIILNCDGLLLDGRNRLLACGITGQHPPIERQSETLRGTEAAFVIGQNSRRRHLTESQNAIIVTDIVNTQNGGDRRSDQSINGYSDRITLAKAADIAGVGRNLVAQASKIKREAEPEVVNAVRDGRMTINAAKTLIATTPEVQRATAAKPAAEIIETVRAIKAAPQDYAPAAPIPTHYAAPAPTLALSSPQTEDRAEPAKPLPSYITLDDWTARGLTEVPDVPSTKTFNRQSDTSEDSMGNIEWAAWSWNPVTGCHHNCPYCYARDIAQRFYPQGFEATIHPDRLRAPYNTKLPAGADSNITLRNVFSNSMSDLYGRWVPQEWIDAVFKAMSENPQWNFLTLTKFPKRAAELSYPKNVWIGTSVDYQVRVKAAEEAFARINCGVKWLSLEPLLEPLKFTRPELFDWVVIGGASRSSQTPDWTPPADWLIRTAAQFLDHGAKIYIKTNGRPREFPGLITPATADEAFRYLGKGAKA